MFCLYLKLCFYFLCICLGGVENNVNKTFNRNGKSCLVNCLCIIWHTIISLLNMCCCFCVNINVRRQYYCQVCDLLLISNIVICV